MTRKSTTGFIGYALVAASVWLSWEVLKPPVIERAPPALAIRIAAASPTVLARAAEGELQAGRDDNAEVLAAGSLAKAPFNVRALRVLGLARARQGDEASADDLLTLAGNWSLRDDPAHAWLIGRRLRQGSYSGAFAHADTIARRRPTDAEPVFNLFASAGVNDPRALPALATIVGANPSWRPHFLTYLIERPDTDQLLLSLAIALEGSRGALTDGELQQVYRNWFAERRITAMHFLRNRIGRPGARTVHNGDFTTPDDRQMLPFGWRLAPGPGWNVAIAEDDLDPENFALRAEYDGYANGILAEQPLFLTAGAHVLQGRLRVEAGGSTGSRLKWTVVCLESGQTIADVGADAPDSDGWRSFRTIFTVPDAGCTVQLLHLATNAGDRRVFNLAWFDDLTVRRRVGAPSRAGDREP
jgi:hypothetical protein